MFSENTSKKIKLSFVIRNQVEQKHRLGINSLQFDSNSNSLFSAGRDSIIRIWNSENMNKPFIKSLEHHTDWVNDIVLCCGGKNLISASFDTTIKFWDTEIGYCRSTLCIHNDYVYTLAYASYHEKLASGGLDKTILVWDVNKLAAITENQNKVPVVSLVGCKNSVYSLAMNSIGTVLVGGGTENILRVWDIRSCQKLMKLSGHSDNIRALIINRDGTQCLSGSSDGTIKLWSFGQRQCIGTIQIHQKGIKTLAVSDSFNYVISGGLDCQIYKTDLRNITNVTLVAKEKNPILKICTLPDFSGIWVSTIESSINFWPLNEKFSDDDIMNDNASMNTHPKMTIEGDAAIKKYYILNNKRFILTLDSKGQVCLYDVLQIKQIKNLGVTDFDECIQKYEKIVYVPNWFSIDITTGFLTIHLGQENCFSAWVNGKDIDLIPSSKINYGWVILKSLLQHWRIAVNSENNKIENNAEISVLDISIPVLSVPQHIEIIITEIGKRNMYTVACNKILYRVAVKNCGYDTETDTLNRVLPAWIKEVLILKKIPAFIKIPYYLLPYEDMLITNANREKFIADDFTQMQRIVEYQNEKLCCSENVETNSCNADIEKNNVFLRDQI